jgi:hypothetical protein
VLVKPAPEQYTALEQALTRLQKRYAELEAKVAAQPAPVQEPVAWPMEEQPDGSIIPVDPSELPSDYYTTPPAAQRTWVGLPDDDVYLLAHPRLARAIETKLKEKNT